jgi:hypothetical protein
VVRLKANRRIWISQETLVGKAYKQGRLADRRIAYKTNTSSVSLVETSNMHRLSRLASDDELENIMPCYTGHGIAVVRSDGNCRKPEPASFAQGPHRPFSSVAEVRIAFEGKNLYSFYLANPPHSGVLRSFTSSALFISFR